MIDREGGLVSYCFSLETMEVGKIGCGGGGGGMGSYMVYLFR